jgi:hypothetical protein
LQQECTSAKQAKLCAALEPVLFADETADSYREIAEKIGQSEGAVKVAALRVRTRLRGLIREEVMQTVTGAEDLEQELSYMMSLFRN